MGIWQNLFGKKKCKVGSQKKVCCDCNMKKETADKNTQSDGVTKEPHNEKKQYFNYNIRTTEIHKGQLLRKNNVSPLQNKGFGCHLYFSVNSRGKSIQPRGKIEKRSRNKKTKTMLTRNYPTNSNEHIFSDNERPKITIACDNCPPTSNNGPQNLSPESVLRKQKDGTQWASIDSTTSTGTYPFQASPKHTITESIVPKPESNQKILKGDAPGLNEKKSDHKVMLEANSEVQIDPNKPRIMKGPKVVLNLGGDKLPTKDRGSDETQTSGSSELQSWAYRAQGILHNPVEKHSSHFMANERSLGNLTNVDKNYGKSQINFSGLEIFKLGEEETLLKEYEMYKKSPKSRKSAKSGTFVRNSLITLRREQRQSVMLGNVTLILNKLNAIDRRVRKLNRKNIDDGKITMGIVCDNKDSSVAIKFNNIDNKDKLNGKISMKLRPSVDEFKRTVQVKSQSECVVINTPGEVKVVQKKCSNGTVNNVTHHNAFEIDAHTLGMNLMPIKCNNPKIFIECPKKTQTSPGFQHRWRRISEELKTSNPDVTKYPIKKSN